MVGAITAPRQTSRRASRYIALWIFRGRRRNQTLAAALWERFDTFDLGSMADMGVHARMSTK